MIGAEYSLTVSEDLAVLGFGCGAAAAFSCRICDGVAGGKGVRVSSASNASRPRIGSPGIAGRWAELARSLALIRRAGWRSSCAARRDRGVPAVRGQMPLHAGSWAGRQSWRVGHRAFPRSEIAKLVRNGNRKETAPWTLPSQIDGQLLRSHSHESGACGLPWIVRDAGF